MLGTMTWFGLGGAAAFYAEPSDEDEVADLLRWGCRRGLPVKVLGEGANILVRDEGVQGLVIRLKGRRFSEIKVEGGNLIAGAGANLTSVIAKAVERGLGGLETLSGIPSSVGGAVVGNAGGIQGDAAQWVEWVEIVNERGTHERLLRDEIEFAYRKSSLEPAKIMRVCFRLTPTPCGELRKTRDAILQAKQRTQPLKASSGGCVFKNVRGISSGSLIHRCGLAGHSVGGASISPVHCNFIVVGKNARSQDVLDLIETIQEEVHTKCHVLLEPEIKIW